MKISYRKYKKESQYHLDIESAELSMNEADCISKDKDIQEAILFSYDDVDYTLQYFLNVFWYKHAIGSTLPRKILFSSINPYTIDEILLFILAGISSINDIISEKLLWDSKLNTYGYLIQPDPQE